MHVLRCKILSIRVRCYSNNVPKHPTPTSIHNPACLLPVESAKALINSRISGSFISLSDDEEAEESVSIPYVLHRAWPGRFLRRLSKTIALVFLS